MLRMCLVATVLASLPCGALAASSPPEFPPGAQAMEAKLLGHVGPQTRAWIQHEAAREAAAGMVTEASARKAVTSNRSLGKLGDGDIEALTFLVMMQSARVEREALKSVMTGAELINKAPTTAVQGRPPANSNPAVVKRGVASATATTAIRPPPESVSEVGEMESLRLQMQMDRAAKTMSTLSNILKKMSDTSAAITQNLK